MKFGLFYLFSDFGNVTQQQLFDEVLEEIELGEKLGQMRIGGLEHTKVMRSMELFAKEVVPALREEAARLN